MLVRANRLIVRNGIAITMSFADALDGTGTTGLGNSEESGTPSYVAPTKSTGSTKSKRFWRFIPRGPQKSLMAAISFRDCESTLKIRMQLIPVYESGEIQPGKHSITFNWAEWIHSFEACMKVLTYDYNDGELCNVRSAEEYILNFTDGETSSNEEIDTLFSDEVSTQSKADAVHWSDAMIDDADVVDQIETAKDDGQKETAAAGDDPRAKKEHLVECTCKRNQYMLNQRAKRVFITGTQKYFWEWEGWKAQEAFRRDRYPILYDAIRNFICNSSSNVNWGDVVQHRTNSSGETRISIPPEEVGAGAPANEPSGTAARRE
ncbi:hypothetical protein FGB62_27g10 [Gracilaria domingensis]|nr:hypothetical protein FGB62_27g10 [Gracilaria domingensis]